MPGSGKSLVPHLAPILLRAGVRILMGGHAETPVRRSKKKNRQGNQMGTAVVETGVPSKRGENEREPAMTDTLIAPTSARHSGMPDTLIAPSKHAPMSYSDALVVISYGTPAALDLADLWLYSLSDES